ncbi:response regulator transcription factor [Acinetobacter sp. ANC 4470]|uniref:response regulator transcription factor n=1 Tax=Acinetobacter sp. ANC 4470 TaxID=1977881 RepID=UPI00148A65DA|nr:response regulator transcription factor [Acinetobacter sp. ANC 4470]
MDQPTFNNLSESILIRLGYPDELMIYTNNLTEAEQLLQQHLPNLILIDLYLDQSKSISLIKKNNKIHPDAHIIVLLAQQETSLLFDAIQAGVQGYIFHEHTEAEILNHIKTILRGGAPIHCALAQYILSHQLNFNNTRSTTAINHPIHLTAIESDILNLILDGLSPQQIAQQIIVPLYIIEGYIKNIYQKIACL